jgi:hypothetical protein
MKRRQNEWSDYELIVLFNHVSRGKRKCFLKYVGIVMLDDEVPNNDDDISLPSAIPARCASFNLSRLHGSRLIVALFR